MELNSLSVTKIHNLIKKGKLKVIDIVKYHFNKINDPKFGNKVLNALVSVFEKDSIQLAEYYDKNIHLIDQKPLFGIPVIIKDNINIKDTKTTCASKMLSNYISPYTATVVERLKDAGAIIIAKSNLDEFAAGSSGEFSCFGNIKNFHNTDYSPGGSSGGSATSVAASYANISLGSDTGGSIRQPASFCGVYGVKPTYSRVSRFGLISNTCSLDTIGPFTRNIEDSALVTKIISGYDIKDSSSSKIVVDNYSAHMNKSIEGKVIGLPKEYFPSELKPSILENFYKIKEHLISKGCKFVDISLPYTKYAISVYYILSTSELSSNLNRFNGLRYGFTNEDSDSYNEMFINSRNEAFGPEIKRRILLGNYFLRNIGNNSHYKKAVKIKNLITADFINSFDNVDLIITPVAANTAFKLGSKIDVVDMYYNDIFTSNINLAGLPATTVPYGKDINNLPIGFQVIGDYFSEKDIFNICWHISNIK